jgi:hypothetical protein
VIFTILRLYHLYFIRIYDSSQLKCMCHMQLLQILKTCENFLLR